MHQAHLPSWWLLTPDVLSCLIHAVLVQQVTEKVKPQADKLPIDQAERKVWTTPGVPHVHISLHETESFTSQTASTNLQGSVVMRAMSRLMGAFTPSKSPPSPAQPFITEMGPPTSVGG
jgi:hypothetical protein